MRGYLWRGGKPQCNLNCEGRLSFPDICRFSWCLLFNTASRHGKNPKTVKEVKWKPQGEGNLILVNLWGFAFVFNWCGRKPDNRRWKLIYDEKLLLLSHVHPASPRLQHSWVISWISSLGMFSLLEFLNFEEISLGFMMFATDRETYFPDW